MRERTAVSDSATAAVQDAVDVWHVALDQPTEIVVALAACLSADERARAARYRTPELRARWTVARAALRHVLAPYAERPAHALRFAAGEHGKPSLDDVATGVPVATHVHFNLSHAGGVALIAVARERRVGVDVERAGRAADTLALARRFFTAAEAARLAALDAEARTRAFTAAWARKEAYLKALGCGIAGGLANVEVTMLPHEPATLLRQSPRDDARWSLHALAPAPGYVGALCVEGASAAVREHGWRAP